MCHILYCHEHSLMLFYLPMPIHRAVMPNALLSYMRPNEAAGRNAALLSAVNLHDHAQNPLEKDATVQTSEAVIISSSCSELLLANKLARLPFLGVYCYSCLCDSDWSDWPEQHLLCFTEDVETWNAGLQIFGFSNYPEYLYVMG